MNTKLISCSYRRGHGALPALLLAALSVLLLISSAFHPGLSVTIGGKSIHGVYDPREFFCAVERTEALAEDILMEDVSLSDSINVRLRLTAKGYTGSISALESSLLEQVPGLARLCAVKVDGDFVGWLSDPSVLGEILDTILAENSIPTTVSAGFTQKITAGYSFAPADTVVDITAVSDVIRELCTVEVVSLQPGATVPGSGSGFAAG